MWFKECKLVQQLLNILWERITYFWNHIFSKMWCIAAFGQTFSCRMKFIAIKISFYFKILICRLTFIRPIYTQWFSFFFVQGSAGGAQAKRPRLEHTDENISTTPPLSTGKGHSLLFVFAYLYDLYSYVSFSIQANPVIYDNLILILMARLFEMIIYQLFYQNVIFCFTRSWKPRANNEIWWIIKVSTHSKTLIHFCWKFIHSKAVYWWFLQIQICGKMRVLFIFQIIDYAWILIMLFDLCLKVMNKILLAADFSFAKLFLVLDNKISILNHK